MRYRSMVKDTPEGWRIVMRHDRSGAAAGMVVLFIGLAWLATFNGPNTLRDTWLHIIQTQGRRDALLVLGAILLPLACCILMLTYVLFGQQLLIFNNGLLEIRTKMFGFTWRQELQIAALSHLRDYSIQTGEGGEDKRVSGLFFEHQGRTYGFGSDLEQAEIQYLISEIRERFPEIADLQSKICVEP